MKRNYALPIAAALVFHAALLFGFRGPPAVVQDVAIMGCDLRDELPRTLEVVPLPEPIDSSAGHDTAPSRLGDPEVHHVSAPDFARTVPPDSFTIPVETYEPAVMTEMNRINPGIPGDPEGAIQGVLKSSKMVTTGMLDNSPRAMVQTAPLYPGEARIRGLEGRVVLGFTVDEDGRVSSPYVISRTDRIFDEAALRAVSQWRFEPGRRHGRVVRFRMAVPIVFSLND